MNEISIEKKLKIIELLNAGKSYRYIARKVGVAKNTISSIATGWTPTLARRAPMQLLDKAPNPTGLCMCGCGGKTNISPQDNYQTGIRKGFHYKYIKNHWNRAQPRGKENPYGYTQYENWKRNNAIWQFIHDLLPARPMKRTEICDLVIPRWPEKKRFGIGHIISNMSDKYQRYIIPKPVLITHCRWCGKDLITRARKWSRHCSAECEKATGAELRRQTVRRKSPILQPISLLCRDFHNNEHDCLSHLAFDIVKTETDAYHPELVASAWLGVRAAWDAGERNRPDLVAAAQVEIKKFRKEDRFSWLSIDAMKEGYDYEPTENQRVIYDNCAIT